LIFIHFQNIGVISAAPCIFDGSHFEVPTLSLKAVGHDLNTNTTKNESQFKEEDIPSLTQVV